LSRLLKKYWYVLFPVLSLVWYLPTYQYGIASDFIGWVYKYKAGDFSDILNCFGYNGLHQVFHFINYSFFSIFGINKVAWYIWFALLHGINASLLFYFLKQWKKKWSFEAKHIEWYVAILFLISPYQVEVVTWKACMHYLLSMMSLMYGFILLINFLTGGSNRTLWTMHALFFASLFVLEINLSAPFMFLAFVLCDHFVTNCESSLKDKILKIFLPQAGLILTYFIMNKLILGDWVGHYGSEEHLEVGITEVIGHGWTYFAKYLGFVHMLSYELKDSIYKSISSGPVVYAILFLLLITFGFAVRKFKNLDRRLHFSGTALVMFFMALVPVLSLFFYYVTPYINDRYSYYASPFFFIFLTSLFYFLSSNWRYACLILYVILNLVHSRNMIENTARAAQGMDYMLQNLPCEDMAGKEVFLLALPDNFGGNYFYRAFTDDAETFTKSLDLFYPQHECQVRSWHNPAQYNMNYSSDAINAHFVDDQTIKVFIAQNGTWFWRKGIGLTDYENEHFRVELKGWYYLLHLKNRNDNQVFYKPYGAEWRKVGE